MKLGYQCDGCKKFTSDIPWNCPGCGVEVCELCFDSYAHCKTCCAYLDDEILKRNAYKFGWDFD